MSGSENGENMDQTIIIGHIALVQQSKRQSFTLEVIRKLRDGGYDAVGIFAGECRDQKYLDELQQMTRQLDLINHVAFLGRRSDIPDLLKLMDVLLIPSFEGFPLVGLEAAATGLPVVACDVAGAKEFIEVSRAGEMFTEGNVQQAAQVVLSTYCKKLEFRENGKRFAKEMALSEYQKNIVEEFCSCL